MVAERFGVGKALNVEMSQVVLDFFGRGREGMDTVDLTDTVSESFSLVFASFLPLPKIHHTPDGLL